MSKARDIADSAATINVLDGVTATATELNYVDGVTSAIQTQLDGKETADATIVKDADIGSTVQAYDSNLTSFVGTFTLPTSDGTADQVLTTNGSGTLAFADAGGGAWVLLTTLTPSASSLVTLTSGFSSTYDHYVIIGSFYSSTSSGDMGFEVNVGGSWATTGYYMAGPRAYSNLSTIYNNQTQNNTNFYGGPLGSSINAKRDFIIQIFDRNSSGYKNGKASSAGYNTSAASFDYAFCNRSESGTFDGIRFFENSNPSNTLTGTVRLYGIVKS